MSFSFLKDYDDPDVRNCTTYTEVIKNRTKSFPNHVVFRFLEDGINENGSFTFLQLQTRAQALAASLQRAGNKGDSVLLLFQPSLEYVASLYACFYSGFIAVPAYPPRRNRGFDRIYRILKDSRTQICLVSKQVYDDIQRNFGDDEIFNNLQWIIYEDIDASDHKYFQNVELNSEDLALIQYTSGSTGQPKGVMISQLNLLYNSEYIRQSFSIDKETVGVHWLPLFHDMGLIGGILQAPYACCMNVNMPPMAFLRNPLNWLNAIHKYRGTIAGGPNFAFDYCIDKTKEEDREFLDLSSMKVFFCGAEPIRETTFKNFSEAFRKSNVSENQLYPCYGMAETTLIVTGGNSMDNPNYLYVDTSSLSKKVIVVSGKGTKKATSIVGCGHIWMDMRIEIVDPVSKTKCEKDRVGEIWIQGQTVAQGYWRNTEDTESIFGAYIGDGKDGPFLRTGDMGFFNGNELFVTGRLKDIIIIRGMNHYPSDIEYSIQNNISELRQNGGAAFPVSINESEKLVIVQEIERTSMRDANYSDIIDRVREVVAENHEIDVHAVILIRPGSIPITSSGKIQHRQAKYDYLHDNLNKLAEWDNINLSEHKEEDKFVNREPTEEGIREWVINWIARNHNYNIKDIDCDKNIISYGIDSLAAVTLEAEISKQFGFQWHISSFLLNPTINKLAKEGVAIYQDTNTNN